MALLHGDITDRIIRGFYNVYNELGHGFLEKVYENAMKIELESLGLAVTGQLPITVYYKGHEVGEYFADLCVEGAVIVELKAAEALTEAHEAQLTNYLKATGNEVGLLFNFGPKPEFTRRIFQEARQKDVAPGVLHNSKETQEQSEG